MMQAISSRVDMEYITKALKLHSLHRKKMKKIHSQISWKGKLNPSSEASIKLVLTLQRSFQN